MNFHNSRKIYVNYQFTKFVSENCTTTRKTRDILKAYVHPIRALGL